MPLLLLVEEVMEDCSGVDSFQLPPLRLSVSVETERAWLMYVNSKPVGLSKTIKKCA